MRCSIQIVTPITSFAHDLRARLLSLGHEVSLSFERPLRCRARCGARSYHNEALWAELSSLQLARQLDVELPADALILELGGLELPSRLSQCQLTLAGPSAGLCQTLERKLEPLGLGALKRRYAEPTQTVARYGGAPRVLLSMISWYLAQEGRSLEWSRVWGVHELELYVSVSDRLPTPSLDPALPSSWRVTLESDDESLSEHLLERLSATGFTQLHQAHHSLDDHIGALVTWGPVVPSEPIKMMLWGAVSEAERTTLGGEATYPRCELERGGSARGTRVALSGSEPIASPSLTLRVARATTSHATQAERAQRLARDLTICLRSERGELSEVARLLRSLSPHELKVVTTEEWRALSEMMSLIDERAYPAELSEAGLIWGEVRCSSKLAPLGAWLRDQLAERTQRRPSLVFSEALGAQELWVLLPKGG